MATAELSTKRVAALEPRKRRWTIEEYYRIGETGIFADERVELIDGEVIDMLPLGYRHVAAVAKTDDVLRAVFGKSCWVRIQAPLRIDDLSEPQPDISVVEGKIADYASHPTTALLVVEVSDTTQVFDLGDKASLYARARIADYWVVDLQNESLHVFRKPIADKKAKFRYRYDSIEQFSAVQRVTPLARPKKKILVADLLP